MSPRVAGTAVLAFAGHEIDDTAQCSISGLLLGCSSDNPDSDWNFVRSDTSGAYLTGWSGRKDEGTTEMPFCHHALWSESETVDVVCSCATRWNAVVVLLLAVARAPQTLQKTTRDESGTASITKLLTTGRGSAPPPPNFTVAKMAASLLATARYVVDRSAVSAAAMSLD